MQSILSLIFDPKKFHTDQVAPQGCRVGEDWVHLIASEVTHMQVSLKDLSKGHYAHYFRGHSKAVKPSLNWSIGQTLLTFL